MAFNHGTSERQSKLTKQLNIQMIKKGGGSASDLCGGRKANSLYLRSRHFQEQFIVYWLVTVSFQVRKLSYIADEILTLEWEVITRANITFDIQEGVRWYLAKTALFGSRRPVAIDTPPRPRRAGGLRMKACSSLKPIQSTSSEGKFSSAVSHYLPVADVLTARDSSLPLKSINVRRRLSNRLIHLD